MMLTPREVEVARLVAAGLSYKGVAARLGISVPTVQSHVLSAAEKLGGSGSPKVRLIVFVVGMVRDEKRSKAS
jgi:DNA-binding CsgD family transcriptional regulator